MPCEAISWTKKVIEHTSARREGCVKLVRRHESHPSAIHPDSGKNPPTKGYHSASPLLICHHLYVTTFPLISSWSIAHRKTLKARCMESIILTALFTQSLARFWRWGFGEFPWLVGRYCSYCSYLLPKQAIASFSKQSNKTLQQNGWIALYTWVPESLIFYDCT